MKVTKQQIKAFIDENFLFGHSMEIGDADSFLENGIIDSTGILELIAFLGREYGITVHDEEMIPENLDSIDRVSAYVLRKLNAPEAPIEGVPILASDEKS